MKTITDVSRKMIIVQVSETKSQNDTSQVIVNQNVTEPLAAEGIYDLQIIANTIINQREP